MLFPPKVVKSHLLQGLQGALDQAGARVLVVRGLTFLSVFWKEGGGEGNA